MPPGLLVMVDTLMDNGFKATGSHSTALTLLLGSVLTGRSFLLFILLAFSGVPTGRVNVFVSGATTYLSLPSLTKNIPGPIHYHSDPGT